MSAVALAVMMLVSWNPFRIEVPAVRRGNEAMRAGRYTQAEKEYRDALIQHPDDPRVLYNLGLSLLAQGKYGEAEAILNKADQADSKEGDDTIRESDRHEIRYQSRFHAGIARFHMGDKELQQYKPMKVDIQTKFNAFESASDDQTKTQAAQKALQAISAARKVLNRAEENYKGAADMFDAAISVRSEEEAIHNRELAQDRIENVEDERDWLDQLEEKLRQFQSNQQKKQQSQKKDKQNQQQKPNQQKQQQNQQKQQQKQQKQQQNQQNQQNQQQKPNQQKQQKQSNSGKQQEQKRQQSQQKQQSQQQTQKQDKRGDSKKGGWKNPKHAKGQGDAKQKGTRKKVDPALRAVYRALDELKARQRRLMRQRFMQMRRYRRKSVKDW